MGRARTKRPNALLKLIPAFSLALPRASGMKPACLRRRATIRILFVIVFALLSSIANAKPPSNLPEPETPEPQCRYADLETVIRFTEQQRSGNKDQIATQVVLGRKNV